MTEDVPADVEAVLTQLFEEAQTAFEAEDVETGVSAVTTAAEVATNKLPEGDLREQLLYGCERTEAVVTGEETEPDEMAGDSDAAVAAEYVAAIERRLAEATAE